MTSNATGVSIQLTEDFVLLPDAARALADLRRSQRRAQSESRSRSRGRSPRAMSPLRDTALTSSHAPSVSPLASTSNVTTPRGVSAERSGDAVRTPTSPPQERSPSAFIRGLLSLTLSKPSRVRRITLRLKGITRTEWPEGIGPRRLEIFEEVVLINTMYPIFSASGTTPSLRRSESVEAIDAALEERRSRRDQYLRTGRGTTRAASVMPGRDQSMDGIGASYSGARDAIDPPRWREPSWDETPPGSPDEATALPSRPSASRQSTFEGGESIVTDVHLDTSASFEVPDEETTAHVEQRQHQQHQPQNGASSAPVSSTARSSFEAPRRGRDTTPPKAPSYQTAASSQRPRINGHDAATAGRLSLTSLLKTRDRSKSRPREQSPGPAGDGRRSRSRGRQMNLKALRDVLTSTVTEPRPYGDSDDEDDPQQQQHQHHWKEFKAGRYVWPIQIAVPVTLPPTLSATFGHVSYYLKANVVRVGALTPNLSTEIKVELVSSPGSDDTEETESIVIERMWDYQMRYLITLSGKAFPIGSHIPISIRMNPMAKIKLYKLTASIEEKTSYFAHGKRITRHEGLRRFQLCKVENASQEGSEAPALLPVMSDDVAALVESPLAPWVINATSSDEHAPRLLDPIGPWEIETNLQLPDCKTRIRHTLKHPASNIEVTHIFKLIMRVERGDRDILDNKGNPKKFDIVIECPIVLLSCRNAVNLLPAYSASGPSSVDAGASGGACACPSTASSDALARQRQFARLVAGSESEAGEIPPTYDASVSPHRPRSSSVLNASPHASPSPHRSSTSRLLTSHSEMPARDSSADSTAPTRGRRMSVSGGLNRLSHSLSRTPG